MSQPSAQPDSFGDPRVDRAVERLHELSALSVSEHVEVLDDIHQGLREALEDAAVDEQPP